MASPFKTLKKSIRRRSADLIRRCIDAPEGSLRRKLVPGLSYTDMLINDYGIVRSLLGNRHRISDDAWRSAQPAPRHIRQLAARGIRTVINLRSDQTLGTRWLEERACQNNDIRLMDVALKSRAAPTKEEFLAIREALLNAEYPILIHCKSGADRAGLMSVMVRHLREGIPIKEARKQLGLRFGHIRQSDTGVLGQVFDSYLEDNAIRPMPFWEWVETRYDPDQVTRSFRGLRWANRLVNSVLQRE